MPTLNEIAAAARKCDSLVTQHGLPKHLVSNQIDQNALIEFADTLASTVSKLLKANHEPLPEGIHSYLRACCMDGFLIGFALNKPANPITKAQFVAVFNSEPDPLAMLRVHDIQEQDIKYVSHQRALRLAMSHAGLDPRLFGQREPEQVDLPDESIEVIKSFQVAWFYGFICGLEISKFVS